MSRRGHWAGGKGLKANEAEEEWERTRRLSGQVVIGGARSEESRGQEKETEKTDVKECKERKQVELWTALRDSSGR